MVIQVDQTLIRIILGEKKIDYSYRHVNIVDYDILMKFQMIAI
jgi:hypothetical protein